MLKISTAPHIHATADTHTIMRDVIIALLPAGGVAVYLFGISALLTLCTSVCGCVLFEYLCCRYWLKKKSTANDLSAIVTGILLAYNLPCNLPLWMTLIGCFVAIVITKMCFGGIGKNLFNPALTGRVFLFISFPVPMTTWVQPKLYDFMNVDITTSATTLNILKHAQTSTMAEELPSYWKMFLGYTGGSMGEISALALLIGFLYLLYRRVISWHIPVYFVGTFLLLMTCSWLFSGNIAYEPLSHLLSGGLLLGAIFMATDYTTSPMSPKGKIIFAVGCGILTFTIRRYGSYPEGVSFAILIMNAFVPLIDKIYHQRIFGMGRK